MANEADSPRVLQALPGLTMRALSTSWTVRYGLRHVCRKCGVDSTFHHLANRKAYVVRPLR